jgi:hypothetical protein
MGAPDPPLFADPLPMLGQMWIPREAEVLHYLAQR